MGRLRCLAFRDGADIELRAKSGKPLGRYFPEVLALLRKAVQTRFVIDGELLIPIGDTLSFNALQMRLHPARSEEHTSELQSLMRISYAVFCLKKKKITHLTIHDK